MNRTQGTGRWMGRRIAAGLCLVVTCGLVALSARVVGPTVGPTFRSGVLHASEQQGRLGLTPADLFQEAERQKDAVGNLEAAIELYRRVITTTTDRTLAARAQLQIAACYATLGRAEAGPAYQTVLQNYADQPAAVTVARAWLDAHTGPAGQAGLRVERIWEGPDVSFWEADLTADGRLLAFVDWQSGGNLAVRDLRTGQSRLITRDAGDDFTQTPLFSADGRRIAYRFGEKDSTIQVIDVDGTNMRIIAHDQHRNYLRAWSPDGRYIAARQGNDDLTNSIVLISTEDGSETRLMSMAGGLSLGAFSKDGKWLVYALDADPENKSGGVFLLSVDGTEVRQLVKGPEQGPAQFWAPIWSPDGRRVFFVSDRSGANALWSVTVDDAELGRSLTLVRDDFGVNGMFMNGSQPLGFSRDGVLYYGMQDQDTDVYVVDFDPLKLTAGRPAAITDRAIGNNAFPSFSPDGKYVVFNRSGGPFRGVIVRALDTGVERELTRYNGAYGAQGVQWFPDSRSILITSGANTQRKLFRKVDIDTGSEQVLFEAPWTVWIGALSPDGRTLYYSIREDGALRLRKRTLETGSETELYQNPVGRGAGLFGLTVSPDGQQLAFQVNVERTSGDTRFLMTMPSAGGTPRKVREGLGIQLNSAMAWMKDGRHLVVTCGGDVEELCVVSTDSGELTRLGVRMEEIVTRVISPDGKRIAFTGRTTSQELWTMRGLLSGAATSR